MRKIITVLAVAMSVGVAAPAFAQTSPTQQNAATSGGDSGPVGGTAPAMRRQGPPPVQATVPASSDTKRQTDDRAQAGGGSR
jgi:hypothetical protein